MAGILYRCIAKSHDGGQRFYEILENEYAQLQDNLAFENSCVKINTISHGCPITDAWALPASDSREVTAYIRLHGNHSHYNGLKPRWLCVNLRARDVWSNFSVNNDLMLENVISLRGKSNDECCAFVDRSLGGPYVDYNLFPMHRNTTSGIVSNWSWWKSIEFIMRVWLLAQKDDAVVVYQLLLDYQDPDFPDRPTNFTYAIRFVAQDNGLQPFLTTCFKHIVAASLEQPADLQQFYAYALERAYLSKTLQRIKRLTGERLQLEDMVKDGLVIRATSLSDGSRASVKEQIQVKWEALRAVAEEIEDKAADKIAKFSSKSSLKNPSQSEESDDSSTSSVNSAQSARSTAGTPSVQKQIKMVIKGYQFDKKKPLKQAVGEFLDEVAGKPVYLVAAYQLAVDTQSRPIICVQLWSAEELAMLMKRKHLARSLGAELQIFGHQGRKDPPQARWANSNAQVTYPRRPSSRKI